MPETEADTPEDGAEASVVEPAPEVHGHPVTEALGETTVHVPRGDLVDLVRALRDEGWLMCLDVTAVDHLANASPRTLPEGVEPERFEVVVLLINHRDPARLRIKVQVPEDDPTVPTLFEVHPGTEALEREVFDMFGISFEGHPDLTRILMPEDWEGHPLRKDYAVGRIPVQFKGDPGPR
ncbi:NADH-quinone oxidoreductase subunit C [Iamia sp. SCSIO 61187]|uniref:NADH-quinone oxidoreductase subunit C n=1 Tax=Iamia sp. SCSIO 61187 TaxID=2722752 RepID=UPI00272DC214|nr:NADH-quinone oxidoreductase subunit C [Iamia sp. SCSIO 61187]